MPAMLTGQPTSTTVGFYLEFQMLQYIAYGGVIIAAAATIIAAWAFDQIAEHGIHEAKEAARLSSEAAAETRQETARLEETVEELRKAGLLADWAGKAGLSSANQLRKEVDAIRASPLARPRKLAQGEPHLLGLMFINEESRQDTGIVIIEHTDGDEPSQFAEEIAQTIRRLSKASVSTHGGISPLLVGVQLYANQQDLDHHSTLRLMDKLAALLTPFSDNGEPIVAKPRADVEQGSFVIAVGRDVALERPTIRRY